LPVVRIIGTSSFNCVGVPFVRYRADYCLFAAEMAALSRQKLKKTQGISQVPVQFAGSSTQ
jgi:hypothetical protein